MTPKEGPNTDFSLLALIFDILACLGLMVVGSLYIFNRCIKKRERRSNSRARHRVPLDLSNLPTSEVVRSEIPDFNSFRPVYGIENQNRISPTKPVRPPPPSVPTYRLQNPAESGVLQEDPSLSSVNLDCVPEKSENLDAVNLACEPEKSENTEAVNLVCETEKSENPDAVNLVCEPEKSENPDVVKLDCKTEKLVNPDCVKNPAGVTVKKPVVLVTFLNSQEQFRANQQFLARSFRTRINPPYSLYKHPDISSDLENAGNTSETGTMLATDLSQCCWTDMSEGGL